MDIDRAALLLILLLCKVLAKMDRTRAFARIKTMAAILLAICFVLPLSRCSTKADPQAHVVAKDCYLYGYEIARDAWRDIQAKEPKGVYVLLGVVNVFFVPILCLGFQRRLLSLIYVLGAGVSAYFLTGWVFVFATSPEIGGIIAIACRGLLFIVGCATLFELWRSGILFKRQIR